MEKGKAAPSCSRDRGGPQVAALELVNGLVQVCRLFREVSLLGSMLSCETFADHRKRLGSPTPPSRSQRCSLARPAVSHLSPRWSRGSRWKDVCVCGGGCCLGAECGYRLSKPCPQAALSVRYLPTPTHSLSSDQNGLWERTGGLICSEAQENQAHDHFLEHLQNRQQ